MGRVGRVGAGLLADRRERGLSVMSSPPPPPKAIVQADEEVNESSVFLPSFVGVFTGNSAVPLK